MTDEHRDDPAQPDLSSANDLTTRQFPRWQPSTVRAAWWAWRSVRRARRDLKHVGVAVRVPEPPRLPWGARTGVNGVLARWEPTCLERAVVMQAWLAAHQVDVDVVIGVTTSGVGPTRAHAWLEGLTDPAEYAEYREIHRLRRAVPS